MNALIHLFSLLSLILCINNGPGNKFAYAFVHQPFPSSKIVDKRINWEKHSNGEVTTPYFEIKERQENKKLNLELIKKEIPCSSQCLVMSGSFILIAAVLFSLKTSLSMSSTTGTSMINLSPSLTTTGDIMTFLSVFFTFGWNSALLYPFTQFSTSISILQFMANLLFPVAYKSFEKVLLTRIWKEVWTLLYQQTIPFLKGLMFQNDKEEDISNLPFYHSVGWLYKGIQKVILQHIEKKIQNWISSMWYKGKYFIVSSTKELLRKFQCMSMNRQCESHLKMNIA